MPHTVPRLTSRQPCDSGERMSRTITDRDGVASKVAKYVPAEMITVATAFFAAFDPSPPVTWVALGIGALLNACYLQVVARRDPQAAAPPRRFLLLSAVAFAMWSAATIDEVARTWGMGSGDLAGAQRAFVLSLAAFVLPLLHPTEARNPAQRRGQQA